MSTIRAYKLAEELKIGNDELLKKCEEIGIPLRSHMVNLSPEQADQIRRRFGVATSGGETLEKRTAGGSVIRRRRVTTAAPLPKEETPSESVGEIPQDVVAAASVVAEDAASIDLDGPVVEEPVVVEPALEEPVVVEAPTPTPPPAVATPTPAPAHARILPDPDLEDRRPAAAGGDRALQMPEGAPPTAGKRPARRSAHEAMNLKEQDTVARTMLGNVQRRLEQRRTIVERQSRLQPRRFTGGRGGSAASRRPVAPGKPGKKVARLTGETSFPDLATQTGIKARELWRRTRALGIEVDRDAKIDLETIQLLAEELGFEVQHVRKGIEEVADQVGQAVHVEDSDLSPRPPVVTVMGHVDHGKTSLLDTLRKTHVVDGEAGGITQHIGAYTVKTDAGDITFLDTPGHAAFTNMRARGAQVTDIVVLVVAADDGVMPQTVEAINHARAADVPIIVAINKIDRSEANPARVKQALLEHSIVAEDFGGETLMAEISAVKNIGIEKLLEQIGLQAEVLELRARADGHARGVIVEAQLDKGRGAVATVLVREGTLKPGDAFVVGEVFGRVRSMTDDLGRPVKQAGPSVPVQIIGLSAVPEAGQELVVVKNERDAKALVQHRLAEDRRAQSEQATDVAAGDDIFASLGTGEGKELRLLIKSDVRGTMEAVRDGVLAMQTERVSVKVIHTGVGGITESDVMLASASDAVVVGFHVRPESAARKAAEREEVEIRTFDIVYELLDDVKALMTGLLPPKVVEKVWGHAEVRELFVVPRRGTIAGCYVPEGTIKRSHSIRVIRDGVPIYSGKMGSLRRFKDDVREVQGPIECGIHIENYNDVKVGDILESFELQEKADVL
jgi:translation initiation factor IF-2